MAWALLGVRFNMGCIKKMLGVALLKDYPAPNLEIELNEGTGGGSDIIHLQTSLWRIELTELEFRGLAATICDAGKRLREIKSIGTKKAKPI